MLLIKDLWYPPLSKLTLPVIITSGRDPRLPESRTNCALALSLATENESDHYHRCRRRRRECRRSDRGRQKTRKALTVEEEKYGATDVSCDGVDSKAIAIETMCESLMLRRSWVIRRGREKSCRFCGSLQGTFYIMQSKESRE